MRKNSIFLAGAVLALCACGSHKTVVKDKPTSDSPVAKNNGKTQKSIDPKDIEYKGEQWVRNISAPFVPTRGMQNRHIALWASHGRYYNIAKGEWEWQRPNLFCTTEDLFTQTIVTPFLMPMLEKAGASVFSPRERDWQTNEVIVDNDDTSLPSYSESSDGQRWVDGGRSGFAGDAKQIIYGSSNPFEWGTTRKTKTSKVATAHINYQPNIPESGKYAVYVTYPTLENSVDDAHYTVVHRGVETTFEVNQRMGGSTWVYLGTFDFDRGCSARNRIILSNESAQKGVVTADAIRLGGGMGNVNRHGTTSGLPRCLEGARYYAQWAGTPDSVYNSKGNTDDYKDDINVRSRMTNWLAGGSCYVPTHTGKNVPIDLSLAVHSDAGFTKDLKSIYGSLAICTTDFNDGKLASGLSRESSKTLATMLLDGMESDMTKIYGKWNKRELYDRNYSETRVPEVPSAIIETLSHQSFPDMRMTQDPNVKFDIARSIYKTLLRFTAQLHDKKYIVAPLPPTSPSMKFVDEGMVELEWKPQTDVTEPSAEPKEYILYTAAGNSDFDNGERVSGTKIRIKLTGNTLYRFKITAVNGGGESFPSEVVAAVYQPEATKTVLVVNGFHRLSAPAVVDDDMSQGFDMEQDAGVSYGLEAGWSGKQVCFDKATAGRLNESGLGYCGNEMMGTFSMGNTFDYSAEHAKAILTAKGYNVVSVSSKAVEDGRVDLNGYKYVDYILGLEKNSTWSMKHYKTFSDIMQSKIANFMKRGGKLLVSGAYIGSDMTAMSERNFLSDVLHVRFSASTSSENIKGMGTDFDIYSSPNATHYATTKVDVLSPVAPAFCTLIYENGTSAAVAWRGNSQASLVLGFPFECVKSDKKKATIMKGILNFLDK